MGGCRCSYKNCKSATKTTENLHFFHYPVKHTERCRKWIENACKPNFFDLAEDQLRNKVVCELHFEERCFTNISRKRLLHDAIPTLDAGCEDVKPQRVEYHHSRNDDLNEIQVLPANEDGTVFTVDTESFQQIPVSEKIESYIYTNGTLVPIYKGGSSGNGDENVVYALEEANFEPAQPRAKNKNGNVLYENTQKQASNQPTYRLLFDTFTESEEAVESITLEDEVSNGTADSPVEQKEISEVEVERVETMDVEEVAEEEEEEKPAIKKNTKGINKKTIQCLKRHSRDIAFIKKALKSTLHRQRSIYQKSSLHSLASRLPPTLFNLVKRTIRQGELNITENELELYKEIHATSPALYDSLKNKYGWNLPEAESFCET